MHSHQLLHNNFQFGGAGPFIQNCRVDSSPWSPWRIPFSPATSRTEACTQLFALQSHQTKLQTPDLSLHSSSLFVIIILSLLFCCLCRYLGIEAQVLLLKHTNNEPMNFFTEEMSTENLMKSRYFLNVMIHIVAKS